MAIGPLFPTADSFRGLGLVLYRKQTRNLTQPNAPHTPYLILSMHEPSEG